VSNEKHFVDLVMEAMHTVIYGSGAEQSKQLLRQFAGYRDDRLDKLQQVFKPIDEAWKNSGKTPQEYRKMVSKLIVKANKVREKAGLESFGMDAVRDIDSVQRGQQYAEIGKWLEIYGDGLFMDGRKKGTVSFMARVRLEIKVEKTVAILRS